MLGKNQLEVLAERDGHRFFTGKKGARVEFGPMRFDFNNLGYRSTNPEILPKDTDVFRVACFGDSVTFGQYERDYYDTWPGAIERALHACDTTKKVEVLNFGMAHYTHTTNLVNLALIGTYVQPDIVIFLIGPNDFMCLYTRDYAPDGSHDGKWLLPIADAVWGFHPIASILNRSRVCALIYGYASKGILLLDEMKLFNLHPSDETFMRHLEIMERHLASICDVAKGLGAVPVLCTYVYNEAALLNIRGEQFPPVLKGIDESVRRVASREGAVVVEANDRMKSHADYFRDDFHLTAIGGKVFAGIIIDVLKQQGLLPLDPDVEGAEPRGSERGSSQSE